MTHVVLPSGQTRSSRQPHGVEVELDRPELFRTRVFVSPLSRRVRVIEYAATDYPALARSLESLALINDLGKVFLKARRDDWEHFLPLGFKREAKIIGYYRGADAIVMSRFLDLTRGVAASSRHTAWLNDLLASPPQAPDPELPPGLTTMLAGPEDAAELAALYRASFETYPFPVTEEQYLRETMASHVVYRLVRDADDALLAAASGETDPDLEHAEMTDFATVPRARGQGLARCLLHRLEDDMRERGIGNLHTLARGDSRGMNRVFHSLGYEFTGTLLQNCTMGGQLQDMHCWCKVTPRPSPSREPPTNPA